MTEEIAIAVLDIYPTLLSLAHAYSRLVSLISSIEASPQQVIAIMFLLLTVSASMYLLSRQIISDQKAFSLINFHPIFAHN